jgi:hypothetical protein
MDSQHSEVTVVDIKMPFWSMVFFMVKWAIAAIPAFLILGTILFMFAVFLGVLGGASSVSRP